MSQAPDRLPAGRERIRTQLHRIRRSQARGMLGIAEIIGLSVSAMLLLFVIVAYPYFLIPAQSRFKSLLLERDRLQKQVRASKDEFQRGEDTMTTVRRITGSLEDFEAHHLVGRAEGRMVLYQELNDLIHKNGLRNTSGPTYASLEPLGSKTQEQAAAASGSTVNRWQSIYPGIAVNVTVEGQYQNIRHFVRAIESSREFIIINAVELERATESSVQPIAEAGGAKGAPPGALVSLRLDLATYYQPLTRASENGSERTAAAH